jgi:enoyl-CoA hydratase/carnithine racemase
MVMPTLTYDGPVWTLDLGSDENRFSSEWLDEAEALLNEVENSNQPVALVTIGSGKFYSNGLDLDWLLANPDQAAPYSQRVQRLLARMLTLPVPTVAAINGHAFGAGAMFAMAHDHRVMRADRGYFCFPEVDIGIPFTPGMAALIMSKLTPRAAIDSMTTGRRFGGEDAHAAGLVDAACNLEDLTATAAELIRDRAGKDRATLGAIKNTMFAEAAAALRNTESA